MENYYDYHFTVSFREIDSLGKIKLSSLLFHTQQSAGEHVQSRGYSYLFLMDQDFVYLLIRYQINMTRYPRHGEKITVRTWYSGTKGASLLRFHKLLDEKGEVVGEASGVWIVASFSKHTVIRPSAFPYHLTVDTEQKSTIPEVAKCLRPETMTEVTQKKVRFSDLDTNNHLTNTAYADIVSDCIDELYEGKEVNSFRICFVKEALYNDCIQVLLHKEGDTYFISGDVDKKPCFDSYATLK